jgi:guanylate kinase
MSGSHRPGRLFVVSGPSGVGKGTVVRALRELLPEMVYSVSATTRPPRAGERDGVDYRFVSESGFDQLVERDAFLEWAEVFGHRYGTLAGPIEQELAAGRNVILEIDVQGAAQIRSRVPEAVLVFLVPPSRRELERRLRGRATESEADLQRRIADTDRELQAAGRFDHVVVNDDVLRAARDMADIIEASH